MCAVSMVMDKHYKKWTLHPVPQQPYLPFQPPLTIMPSPAEIDEFRKLLEKAREYDKEMGQEDCELEEKRARVKKLAEELGVKIDFI